MAKAGNTVSLKVRNRAQSDHTAVLMRTLPKDEKTTLMEIKEASLNDQFVADKGTYLHR